MKRGVEMELIRKLSPRRRQVFDRVVDGKKTSEIAAELGIAEGTVRQHRQMILIQLNINSAVQMTMLAARAGLIGGSGKS